MNDYGENEYLDSTNSQSTSTGLRLAPGDVWGKNGEDSQLLATTQAAEKIILAMANLIEAIQDKGIELPEDLISEIRKLEANCHSFLSDSEFLLKQPKSQKVSVSQSEQIIQSGLAILLAYQQVSSKTAELLKSAS